MHCSTFRAEFSAAAATTTTTLYTATLVAAAIGDTGDQLGDAGDILT